MKLSDGGEQPPTGAVSSVMTAYGIVFSAINGAMKRSYTSNEAHIFSWIEQRAGEFAIGTVLGETVMAADVS